MLTSDSTASVPLIYHLPVKVHECGPALQLQFGCGGRVAQSVTQ